MSQARRIAVGRSRVAMLAVAALVGSAMLMGSIGRVHSADQPAANLQGPTTTDRQVTLAVTALLRSEHLTGHPLDSEITGRTLHLFLKSLDPRKLYFYQL